MNTRYLAYAFCALLAECRGAFLLDGGVAAVYLALLIATGTGNTRKKVPLLSQNVYNIQ